MTITIKIIILIRIVLSGRIIIRIVLINISCLVSCRGCCNSWRTVAIEACWSCCGCWCQSLLGLLIIRRVIRWVERLGSKSNSMMSSTMLFCFGFIKFDKYLLQIQFKPFVSLTYTSSIRSTKRFMRSLTIIMLFILLYYMNYCFLLFYHY